MYIYHGSNQYLINPTYGFEHKTSTDYGRGFYCTKDKEAAKEWACKYNTAGYLVTYQIDDSDLRILDLTDKSRFSVLNWFALLCKNRTFPESFRSLYQKRIDFIIRKYLNVNVDEYDVVIGYRADDAYFNFPKYFISGGLTLESLEEVFKYGELGLQYVLISEKAYKALRHVSTERVDPAYTDLYRRRIDLANYSFDKLLRDNVDAKGTRITELMNND